MASFTKSTVSNKQRHIQNVLVLNFYNSYEISLYVNLKFLLNKYIANIIICGNRHHPTSQYYAVFAPAF